MFFLRIRFFGFFLLLFQCQQVLALTFEPIAGPYVKGAQVPVQWTLDGSEPANGWELWFNEGGSSIKLSDIPLLAISTVVTFPGSNGAFQGVSGTTVLATSNEVDLDATGVTIATTTFSASVVSGSSSIAPDSSSVIPESTSAAPTVSHSSAAESVAVAVSKSSAVNTGALLGIVVATLVVIGVIVFASVSLFVYRRRRIAAATDPYPTKNADVEKQLALKITPFNTDALGISPPPRGSSLPQPPPPPAKPSPSDLRRQAYLNSQLQKLEVPPPNRSDPESGSIVFGPLSSVPSESIPPPVDRDAEPTSPPLPPLPFEVGSRRAAFLSEQLQRLEVAERRPSDGSVVFGPLSSVPSEGTARPSAPTISSVTSPIQFIRQAPSQITSPVSPLTRRPPW
ncbi:hypothetical protein MSAN_01234300 [Mycena sanguinolenta]|uniref:Uncharacterized protein n=1 Tax=Mycena sanguinolenta TaxID=230812 RepID=A0A8H6YIM6_9AGAR|nr:hypothetical protein MSAN_01234300 [Mycena sanguinolenta]